MARDILNALTVYVDAPTVSQPLAVLQSGSNTHSFLLTLSSDLTSKRENDYPNKRRGCSIPLTEGGLRIPGSNAHTSAQNGRSLEVRSARFGPKSTLTLL